MYVVTVVVVVVDAIRCFFSSPKLPECPECGKTAPSRDWSAKYLIYHEVWMTGYGYDIRKWLGMQKYQAKTFKGKL